MAKKIFFFFSGSWLTKVPSSSLCILLVQALAPLHTITSKRDIPGYVHAITRLRWQGVNDLDWAKMKLSFASFLGQQGDFGKVTFLGMHKTNYVIKK